MFPCAYHQPLAPDEFFVTADPIFIARDRRSKALPI
jgi:hypothetical protein